MCKKAEQVTDVLSGFSPKAKMELDKVCEEYREHIIEESRKVERHERIEGKEVEITATHVKEARRSYRKEPPKKTGKIVLNVIVDLMLLILGFVFDKEAMLNSDIRFIAFLLLLLVTVVLAVVKYAKEV